MMENQKRRVKLKALSTKIKRDNKGYVKTLLIPTRARKTLFKNEGEVDVRLRLEMVLLLIVNTRKAV